MFGFEAKDYVIGGVAVAGLATGIVANCRVSKTNDKVDSLQSNLKSVNSTCDQINDLVRSTFTKKKPVKKAPVETVEEAEIVVNKIEAELKAREIEKARLKSENAELEAKLKAKEIEKAKLEAAVADGLKFMQDHNDAELNAIIRNVNCGQNIEAIKADYRPELMNLINKANVYMDDIQNLNIDQLMQPVQQPQQQQPIQQPQQLMPQPIFVQPQPVNQPIQQQQLDQQIVYATSVKNEQVAVGQKPNPTMKARIDRIDAMAKKAEDNVNNIVNKNLAEIDAKINDINNAPLVAAPVVTLPAHTNSVPHVVEPNPEAVAAVSPELIDKITAVERAVIEPIPNAPIQKPAPHGNNKRNNKKSRKH